MLGRQAAGDAKAPSQSSLRTDLKDLSFLEAPRSGGGTVVTAPASPSPKSELNLDKLPWGTIFGGLIVTIVAVVGGLVVVFGDGLNFETYVRALGDVAVGVGLVAIGRGVTKAGAHISHDPHSR